MLFHHRSLSMVKEVGGMVLFHHRSMSIGKEAGYGAFPP